MHNLHRGFSLVVVSTSSLAQYIFVPRVFFGNRFIAGSARLVFTSIESDFKPCVYNSYVTISCLGEKGASFAYFEAYRKYLPSENSFAINGFGTDDGLVLSITQSHSHSCAGV